MPYVLPFLASSPLAFLSKTDFVPPPIHCNSEVGLKDPAVLQSFIEEAGASDPGELASLAVDEVSHSKVAARSLACAHVNLNVHFPVRTHTIDRNTGGWRSCAHRPDDIRAPTREEEEVPFGNRKAE